MRRSDRAKTATETAPSPAESQGSLHVANDPSDQTSLSRYPSEPTEVTQRDEVTKTDKVVGLAPSRPRRNYTWFNPDDPRIPASRAERGKPERRSARPDVRAAALQHMPQGDRLPPIVRVREVRRDYEYHYEYVYEEGADRYARSDRGEADPAPRVSAPPPPQQLPAAPAPQAHAVGPVPPAASVPPPSAVVQPSVPPPSAPQPVAPVPSAPPGPMVYGAPGASAVSQRPAAMPAPKAEPVRASLASRAGPTALGAVGVVLAIVAIAVMFLVRAGGAHIGAPGQAAAKPPANAAPATMPAAPPPAVAVAAPPAPALPAQEPAAVAAPTPTVTVAAPPAKASPRKRKAPPSPY